MPGAVGVGGLGRPLTASGLGPACSAASKSRPFLRPGRGHRPTKRRRRVRATVARLDLPIGAPGHRKGGSQERPRAR
eukprot:12166564-Alexandrium_andersonii.AAC.1